MKIYGTCMMSRYAHGVISAEQLHVPTHRSVLIAANLADLNATIAELILHFPHCHGQGRAQHLKQRVVEDLRGERRPYYVIAPHAAQLV